MAFKSLSEQQTVSRREIFAYSIAGGGQNLAYGLITGYLMYFYINVFHIDPRAVSIMLLIEGIWDIINNPMAGMIIDRTRTKYGKMIPYLRACTAPLALFTCLLFAGPYIINSDSALSPSKIAYMFITYILWELFYTVTDVAYWGLSAAISPLEGDRRRVMTATNVSTIIGNNIPFLFMPLFIDYSGANPEKLSIQTVFLIFGLIAGCLGIGLFSLSGWFVNERVEQSSEGASFKESLRALIDNKGLRCIVLSGLIGSVVGLNGVFMTYYYIDVLGFAGLSILVNIPSAISWALSYKLLPVIRRRFDARQFAVFKGLVFGGVCIAVFFIGIGFYRNPKVMIPILMAENTLFGLLSAPREIFQNEMLADATDYAEWTTGKRNEGVSFSLRITTVKIGGTVVQALGSAMLSAIGYVTSSENSRVPQTTDVQFRIWILFALIPAIFELLSVIPFFSYDLVGEKRERMRNELERIRSRQSHAD